MAIEQMILDAAAKPTKKKKRIAPKQNTGTHFADGTVGGRLRGTAIDEMEAAPKPTVDTPVRIVSPARAPLPTSPPTGPPIKQTTTALKTMTPEKTTAGIASDSDSDGQQSYAPNSSDNDSEFSSPQPKFNTRAGAMLAKRPSIVHEDREREEEEDTTPRPADPQRGLRLDMVSTAISPSPVSRLSADKGHGRGQALASAAFAQERQHARSASQPAPVPAASDPPPIASNEGGTRGVRVDSVSPARTTHFAPIPDQLAVKHSPPPRAVSPRKSALKHNSSDSPRGQSPASGVNFGYGSNVSEGSTGSAGEFEEQPFPRKKSVRVSFDEKNVVVGRAAGQEPFSPLLQSPQNDLPSKRTWLNITGRGKKKETNATGDDDEVMQPRPALPSFGSVRERKQTREPVEERQLVKPAELVEGASSTVGSTKSPLGQSNDHVVGAIISQDVASRNAANISRSREPLPPQVTSVEGSGYSSDGGSTIGRDSDDELDVGTVRASHIPPRDVPAASDRTVNVTANSQVPKISISGATPNLDETHERKEWLEMPGGWSAGGNPNSGSPHGDSPTSEHRAINATPATVGIAEPLPDEAQDGSPVLGHIAEENLHDHNAMGEEADESDATSIYSDAAEELSDVEGGFMSLDAVVDSPVLENRSTGILTSALPDSPTARGIEVGKNQYSEKSSEPGMDERWEKTQKYWGSLSADKKLQLEQEAREEAEASDSTIEAPKPTPKPKKKAAAQPTAPGVTMQPQPVMHDRTYMMAPGSKATTDNYMPTMRSSMRAAPAAAPPDTHMRMSLRNQGVMRNSMREPPQTAQQKGSLMKNRPMSLPPSSITSDATAVNTHIKALTAVAAARSSKQASLPPSLRRQGSADSNSSFKRTRAGENTTFRR
jgi:serine/arginine repetitive matrix protein 2